MTGVQTCALPISPVVLVTPGAAAIMVLVTATLILQPPVPPALNGTVAPVIAIEVSLAMLPAVTVPPQVLLKPGIENTFIPAGKISLHATPLMACVVDGLAMVNVRVVLVLATMVVGLKLFATAGAARRTLSDALAATVLPPASKVLRNPVAGDAGIVLV